MYLRGARVLALIAVATATLWGASPAAAANVRPMRGGEELDVVVVVRNSKDSSAVAARHRVNAHRRYTSALRGFAARVTREERDALSRDPDVAFVEPDRVVRLAGQIAPTSVNRAEADLAPAARINGRDERVDADIAIIDTGIQPDHPDLNVAGGYNCINSRRTAWGDGNGHGTHVAGIAAALDNSFGTVGVAPGARLWAVKVFDANGYSRLSWIVCGIDWVTAQRDPGNPSRPLFEAANMSLRDAGLDDRACGAMNRDAEHAAICRSVARGVTYAVAAGNDATSASRWIPAAYNEVITVAALADYNGIGGGGAPQTCAVLGSSDADDTFANFSNYGPDVDIVAPGKCIRSTYPGSTYKVSSGTSMATPAVTGAIALYKSLNPGATPAVVRSALRSAGSTDWFYGTDPDGVADPLLNVYGFGGTADATPPRVTRPLIAIVPGSRITSANLIALQARWSGSDNRSGIAHYDLHRAINRSGYATVIRPNAAAPSGVDWRPAGHLYGYRTRSWDHAGNASVLATAPRVALTAVQSTNTSIVYRGRWTVSLNARDYGGGTKFATVAGATARYTFSARQVAWIAPKSASGGSARVYVDGVYAGIVSLHSSTLQTRRVVFQRTWPRVGTHTVTIQVVGTRGRPRVDLDAFLKLS